MRSTFAKLGWPVLPLCLGAWLLCASEAQAGARRPGLAGSLLIEDADDVFVFPQRLTAYPNLISLAYGGAAGTGNGLLTLGSEALVFGVALHRGDVLAPHAVDELAALGGPGSALPPPFSLQPATVFDALFAFDACWGELGGRLAVGAAGDSTTAGGGDDGQSHTFMMAEVGAGRGTRGQDVRTDVSAAFALELGALESAGSETASGTRLHGSLLTRVFIPIDAKLDLGVLGNVAGSSGAFDVTTVDVDGENQDEVQPETLAFSIAGGAGPALRLGRASVAGYGLLRFEVMRNDPDLDSEDDESSRHVIAVPALHMALEVPIGDWFTVRSGAEYAFEIRGQRGQDELQSDEREGRFGWNLGFGLNAYDFYFDASLQHGFVTHGPSFIGGGEPGFLAIASATYDFDAARKADTVQQ